MKYFTLRLLDVLAQCYAKVEWGEYWVDEGDGGGYTFFVERNHFENDEYLLSFVNFVLDGLPQSWGIWSKSWETAYLPLTMDEISGVISKKNKAQETKSQDRLFLEHLLHKVNKVYNEMIFELFPYVEVYIGLKKDNKVYFDVEVEGEPIARNELVKFHRFLLGHSPFRGVSTHMIDGSEVGEMTSYYYADTMEGLGEIEYFIRRQEDEIYGRFQAECTYCNYEFLTRYLSQYHCNP